MTYAQDEASVEDGNPVELYEFAGTFQTYRYTSSEDDVDFNPGSGLQTFSAVPVRRGNVSTPPDGGSPEMSVVLPTTAPVVAAYAFTIAPPGLYLKIYRVHITTGNFITLWEGEVAGISVSEREATLRIPSPLVQRFEDKIPAVHYQRLCNNVLFDTLCGVIRSSYLVTTAVATSGISADGKQITVSSMSPQVSGWALGGDIVKPSTGERRMIIDHTGNVLTVLWPFSSDLSSGDVVEVSAGCDHSIDSCVDKFGGNQDSFTGMPFVVSQDINFSPNGGE